MKKTRKIIIKYLILCISICLVLNCIIMPIIYADDFDENETIEDTDENIKKIIEETRGYLDEYDYTIDVLNKNKNTPIINARKCAIFDRGSKRVIYGKNNNTKCAMASTTKIMTAIIVLEKTDIDLNKEIIISQKAASIGGSRIGLKKGDKISIRDLLYGLMLKSGNDAAIAIAEEIGGSVEEFVKKMNSKAEDLKLRNTHFVTPHGLDNPEHYTTATELAILTDYALSNNKFKEIVGTKRYIIKINGNNVEINNTNELLGTLNGVAGVKTGFTNGAGRCLVTETIRGKRDLIVVVLGADTKKDRTRDSIKLIEYGFNCYREVNLKEEMNRFFDEWNQINGKRIKIEKGKDEKLQLYLSEINKETILVEENDNGRLEYEINSFTRIKAPIAENQRVGNVVIKYKDEIIDQVEILVKKEVEKKKWFNYYYEFCQNIFNKKLFLVLCKENFK